jgi:hypothetical protein
MQKDGLIIWPLAAQNWQARQFSTVIERRLLRSDGIGSLSLSLSKLSASASLSVQPSAEAQQTVGE